MRHLIFCLPVLPLLMSACIAEPDVFVEPDAGACAEPPEWTVVELVATRGEETCALQGFHLRSPDGVDLTERHLAPGCNFDGTAVDGHECRPYGIGSRFRLPYARVLMSWCASTNDGWDFRIVNE